jgi:hypothetical protein
MSTLVICPACDGHGTDASTAIALTSDDIAIQCGDDWDARADFVREVAALTAPCPLCHRRNVVTASAAREWEADAQERADDAALFRMECAHMF